MGCLLEEILFPVLPRGYRVTLFGLFQILRFIRHHIYSSIWTSIKGEISNLFSNSSWCLGSGRQINFSTDPWTGDPLINDTDIEYLRHKGINLNTRIVALVSNGS